MEYGGEVSIKIALIFGTYIWRAQSFTIIYQIHEFFKLYFSIKDLYSMSGIGLKQ